MCRDRCNLIPVSPGRHRQRVAIVLTAGLLLFSVDLAAANQSPDASKGERLFALKVKSLLAAKCFACHGEKPDEIQGELVLTTRAGMLKGGEASKKVLVPGKAKESLLYVAVTWDDDALQMPPKENDRLTEAEAWSIRDWINVGAPWPSDEKIAAIRTAYEKEQATGVVVQTSGGLSEEWTNRRYQPENLWPYQSLIAPPIPASFQGATSVDAFINRKLQQLEIEPAAPVDCRTLIRRATYDLTGLPPTPEEVEAFVTDTAADDEAFRKVVERLLASPHYGEQWARHWLDVVRYADSSGYANDYERSNAWRYRDYVVRAFNDDKPYDRFIREQIAGDELDPDDPEMLVAVGFLRMGPWELTGMEVAKVARQRFLDDVTDAVGQVFLGHMLQCARCHDHKFDPVPTRDYYSIQAAFATTQLAERQAAFLPNENTAGFDEKKYLDRRAAFYRETLNKVNKKRTIAAARQWYADKGLDPAEFEKVVAELESKQDRKKGEVSVDDVRRLLAQRKVHPDLIPPRHVGFTPEDYGLERIARKGLERLKWRFERYEPIALSVYTGRTPNLRSVNTPQRMPANRMQAGELEETCILAGGDPFSPKDKVAPGVLSAVQTLAGDGKPTATSERQMQDEIAGRRSALAEWIASPDNPLTARVMVNRIWQWHFGTAIAGNANNFGTTGKKPTHPELLDHLAAKFIESGWSVKAMHRLIMLSDAYRRSSQHPVPQLLADRDPHGTSYAVFQPRRLDAEELRDAMLAVSGELNREVGGIPVCPEMNLEAALQPRMVMGTFAEAWQPSPKPEQRHRRSLYALRIRGQRDPFFEVFNAPTPDLSCEAREASTVTPQVFAMFNSEISFDRALAVASRLAEEKLSPEETIDRLFQLTYSRSATPDEIAACVAHWKKMAARHKTLTFDPPVYPNEVVREAVEENTGEKFTFVEPLEVYDDFVPDLKPSDVGPRVRGLAEVCLVVLNSNEFAYVY